ncbi:hypothetical protein KCV06_g249, partial [Aureobasidium melanogenum]
LSFSVFRFDDLVVSPWVVVDCTGGNGGCGIGAACSSGRFSVCVVESAVSRTAWGTTSIGACGSRLICVIVPRANEDAAAALPHAILLQGALHALALAGFVLQTAVAAVTVAHRVVVLERKTPRDLVLVLARRR